MGDTGVAVNPEDEKFKHLIGKTCILPIMNREIPIVGDEYCEIGFGTGAVKMTPAHDPNDFEVGLRHNLEVIRVIAVLIVPLVALAVPITDTLLAIVRRKSSGVPIFSPDKNHLHHRLLAKGLNQKQVVLIMYALTAFFSCIALVVIHLSLWAGIAIVAAALILFILWARKLGVMKEIVPSPYQMKMKKEKEEKGKESKSKGPEEKPALK